MLFGDKKKELLEFSKELLAAESKKPSDSQIKRWKKLMNATNGDYLEEALALKECLRNPGVALKLIEATPRYIADLHSDYLQKIQPPLKQAFIKPKPGKKPTLKR